MYIGSWKIDDLVTFTVNTHRFDTGAATDADSVPSYRVYEDETGTAILTGSMALLDSSNTAGFYSEQITLSAANGFEKGKSYNIYISATVNSVTATTSRFLQIEAEVDVNTVSPSVVNANVTQWLGSAAATPTVAGVPEVDVTHWIGSAAATPSVAGVPEVDVTHLNGVAQSLQDLKDFADDGYDPSTNKVQGVVLTDTVTTYTGNTPQTGDSFARLGAPAGASVSADIAAIEAQTDDIGTAGAGLTAIPWNSAWDTEVQSEVTDAIEAARLDELLAADSDIDGATPPTVGSVFHELLTKTAGSFTYDQTTDSLEAIRDRGDAAWVTGTAPTASAIADAVWDETLSEHLGAGSTGAALNSAGSAGDPWGTALPGAYGAGTAGKIIGDNLNATVGSRATQTSVDTVDDFLDTEITDIRNRLPAALVSGRMDASVGAMATDTLTAAALAADAVAEIQSGLSTLNAAGVRSAIGMASANLDTQLGDIPTAAENADKHLGRNIAGGSDGGRTVTSAYRALRNKVDTASEPGFMIVTEENDTTEAWRAAVTTNSAAEPIVTVDPT